MTATVRRHRRRWGIACGGPKARHLRFPTFGARNPRAIIGWGAVATAVLWAVAVLVQPPPFWRPGHGLPPEEVAGMQLTGPPTWLRIGRISVDAPLVPLRLDATGSLEAPKDYNTPGWYAEGTAPGDTGPAVIAGHVDSLAASAVFRHLADLRAGDVIEVQRDGIWLRFDVVSTGRYPKGAFPTAQVYGPTPDAQLRLITCGGSFDRTRNSYRDNVVVFAIIKSDH
jgi:Sortase domain